MGCAWNWYPMHQRMTDESPLCPLHRSEYEQTKKELIQLAHKLHVTIEVSLYYVMFYPYRQGTVIYPMRLGRGRLKAALKKYKEQHASETGKE